MSDLPTHDKECFFIAPIGEEGSDTRLRSDGVLNYIVRQAAEDVGLRAVRADEISKPGQITLQVIEHVTEAAAVVADLTNNNPNVYYELAGRHAAQKPVVQIAEEGTALPFDIAQMRTIFFDHHDLASAANCRAEISNQLRSALSEPVVDSPFSTVMDMKALRSGNLVEQNIAELVETVSGLAGAQQTFGMMLERLEDRMLMSSRELPRQAQIELREFIQRMSWMAGGRGNADAAREVIQVVMHSPYLREIIGMNLQDLEGLLLEGRMGKSSSVIRDRQSSSEARARLRKELDENAVPRSKNAGVQLN